MTIDSFLAAHGFAAAIRTALPGDAGHRRYLRLTGGPAPALLMDASAARAVGLPSAADDLARFIAVANHLRGAGLPAPAILAAAPEAGLLLVEDLGQATAAERLDTGADPLPLYLAAADLLAALHAAPPPAFLPRWDATAMSRAAAATFCDWWWPAALGRDMREAERAGFDTASRAMLAPFAASGFVHRDYFPANLIPRPDGTLGLIDFQDAALGHPAYDLVSLVEDARRDVAPAIREAAIARYVARRPGLDETAFRAAMAAHAAQRHLRVAALWVRLARRDSKPGYLVHGPRCWALLDRALAHPAAAPLADFLDAHVPRHLRKNPAMLEQVA